VTSNSLRSSRKSEFAGHSLRRVHDGAARAGRWEAAIMRHRRWKSVQIARRYNRRGDDIISPLVASDCNRWCGGAAARLKPHASPIIQRIHDRFSYVDERPRIASDRATDELQKSGSPAQPSASSESLIEPNSRDAISLFDG
jgi:hypothetical protein